MSIPPAEAGLQEAAGAEPGRVQWTRCPGCGRDICLPPDLPGVRFMCARCHYPQGVPGRGKGSDGRWFRAACTGGFLALAAAGISLCALYYAGTGREDWFAFLLLAVSLTLALPLGFYRRRRHPHLLVSAMYLPFGLLSLLWYLAPGVGWDYASSLVWGGVFFVLLGAGALYLYRRDLRSLSRW